MDRYRDITLCADVVMYVNAIPMLVSISRNVRFATVEALANRRSSTFEKSLRTIKALYYILRQERVSDYHCTHGR